MTIKRFFSLLVCMVILNVCFSQSYISKTLQFDGLTRAYEIYVPSIYDGTIAVPLIFNFHGGNGTIADQKAIGDLSPLANTDNFIAVYPQARPDPSDGNSLNWLPKSPGTFDDVPLVSALIDAIADDYQIDQNRIYACGYSLGGEFSFELACKLNNRIAAIGVVARTMQAKPENYCAPIHPTGVLTILGTDDFISPYEGLIFGNIEYYISAAATHSYWAEHNGCNPIASKVNISSSVERYTWSTDSECAYVEEFKVIGGGHDWPGSFGNMTIDATQEIWQFVSRYDINGLIDCGLSATYEENKEPEGYNVFPNPFNENLTIDFHATKSMEFKIYSLTGELVVDGKLSSQTNVIDLSSLVPNVYILKIGNRLIRIVKIQ